MRILFESWRGAYADNPRAISQFLQRAHPELEQFWVIEDPALLPAGLRPVKRHSPRYFRLLWTADIIVTNDIISRHIFKGPKANYLQTWHGTPLKTLGYDEAGVREGKITPHHRRMFRDVAKWDALLSPSPEVTDIFRRAFGYSGRVLETGSPRNDILLSPAADTRRTEARQTLGIPHGAAAVLYAPTWRDDRPAQQKGFVDPGGLDIDIFLASTPDNVFLMLKMHPNVVTRYQHSSNRVLDVSHVREMADLILAADVLVSDYSSVVFDFAVTRKPIVLFPYDLERYQRARGLYFDYAEWAPGPIATTTEELAQEIIRALGSDMARTRRYERFLERFCPLEDGNATRRVYTEFFAPLLQSDALNV